MKRMTRRTDDGTIERMCPYLYDQSKANCVGCPQRDKCGDPFFAALARYEDTGLTPDICEEYKKFEDELVESGLSFKNLLSIVDSYKVGTMKPLPCHIGGKLYRIQKYTRGGTEWYQVREFYLSELNFYRVIYEEYGKTVFASRGEAEAQCERMKIHYEANSI